MRVIKSDAMNNKKGDLSPDRRASCHDFANAPLDEAAQARLAESVIHGRNGYLVVYGAGEDAVLVMQGPIESNLGLMRIEARVAAVEIKQLLTRA